MPGSPAVAVLVQTRPRVPVPSRDCRRVHPAGVDRLAVVEAVVRNSTRESPARTVDGTVTVWPVRLPAVLVAAT